ncbi:zinc finger, CCHC-type containing protein [Tanacetum coccineum]
MAAYTKRMERFKNAIFKQREEINDRMAEMVEFLKELTATKTLEMVLMREEARHPITKNINSISLIQIEEGENRENNRQIDKSIMEPGKSDEEGPLEGIDTKNEVGRKADDEPTKRIAEDVSVDVVGYVYFMDFVILDIRVDEKRPFILGTPFLTTAKAVIKFDKGTITLRSGKSKISFHRIPEPNCRIEKGIKNDIEPIAPTMTVNRLVLEWEEKIKLHQEKEMKFDQWRSKIFNNEHPASVKEECEVEDEGEVT